MHKIGTVVYGSAQAALAVMPYLNGVLGLVVVFYVLQRLLWFSEQYNRAERFGMALTAAGMVLATPALWIADTPFDGWSFNVGRVGVVLYIITGGLRRDRHARRNAEQVAIAAEWRASRERGK